MTEKRVTAAVGVAFEKRTGSFTADESGPGSDKSVRREVHGCPHYRRDGSVGSPFALYCGRPAESGLGTTRGVP